MPYTNIYETLGLTPDQVRAGLDLLTKPRIVRKKGEMVTLPPALIQDGSRFFRADLYHAELEIACHIRRLQDRRGEPLTVPAGVFGALTPDESQQAALDAAAGSNVVVLTGGPGVGKTTVSRAMITTYEHNRLVVACCAPTGKAAVRMKEQTGRDALTIHQLLGLRPGAAPTRNEGNPIEADVVVVDETSMVDVDLAAKLLAAVPGRLLIIGDVDQLPSIGAGRILHDLIASQILPVVRLTKIHRQASESRIPYVARDINQGQVPDMNVKGSDVTHWEQADADHAAAWVVRAVTQAVPSKGFEAKDIQVLAPQKKGPCGVHNLNLALQAALNPPFQGATGGDVFIGDQYAVRAGDRVIQTRNNYELAVMNGEIGVVIAADPRGLPAEPHLDATWSGKVPKDTGTSADRDPDRDYRDDSEASGDEPPFPGLKFDDEKNLVFVTPRVLVVDFGTRKVAYSKDEARELHLGYAITVHKSQGSQFKAVVVALHVTNVRMLSRPLLYTAITRAAEFVLTVGTVDQVAAAARNTRGVERRTSLQERLTSVDPRRI